MNTEGLSEEVCCERALGEGEGRGRRGPTLMWGSSLSRGPAWPGMNVRRQTRHRPPRGGAEKTPQRSRLQTFVAKPCAKKH